jgi:hypothetical protein
MTRDVPLPWVIVAGGFHQSGAMDKANAALAAYLLCQGVPVHLVGHTIAPEFRNESRATVHEVRRPAGAFVLGDFKLSSVGKRVAQAVTTRWKGARVLVNGGNCAWPDVNWVHSVHHMWPCADDGAPMWFKVKNRFAKRLARRDERRALSVARLILTNSNRTGEDVKRSFGVDPAGVRTVYLGADPGAREATPSEQVEARQTIGARAARPLVVFVGALSHDDNKGLGVLLAAWTVLCADPAWDADLAIA